VNGETHDALAYYQQQHPGGMPAVRHCRSCGAHIFWSYTRHGRRCPYDFDVATTQYTSVSHFATCPHAQSHTRPRAQRAPVP
jgi:hypothetical protein